MPDAGGTSFEQLFPKIKEIRTVVRQVGEQPEARAHVFTKENWPHHGIKCINRRCTGGGYDLSQSVQSMVEKNMTHQKFEGGIPCPGRAVIGQMGRKGRSCPQRLECEIHITFREDSPPQAA